MASWHNLIHLDEYKETIRLAMNDMKGIYIQEERNLAVVGTELREDSFLEKLLGFINSHISTLRDTSFYSMTPEQMDLIAVILNDNIDYLDALEDEDKDDPEVAHYRADCHVALDLIQRIPRTGD